MTSTVPSASPSVWVFGYGSLVSPASVGATIGRVPTPGVDVHPGTLHGHGRRWNYGSLRQRADWTGPGGRVAGGVVVSLGVAIAVDESTNGSIVRVDAAELALLDLRESDYDRVDVTDAVALPDGSIAARDTVVTYVPRRSAIDRYEAARAAGRAAVRQDYVDLVEEAFADLGADHLDRYRATTPRPDVPVVEVERRWLADLDDEPHPESGTERAFDTGRLR